MVIGYNVWRAKFAANREVLGQQVRLDGVSGEPSILDKSIRGVTHTDDVSAVGAGAGAPQNGEVHQMLLTLRAGPTIQPNLAGRLREIAAALDPALRVEELQTLEESYRLLSIGDLAGSGVVAGLTLCGVLFSVAGIYTSMAFTVVQRRCEIGIRSALGAPPWRLIAGVFRQVLLPAGGGVTLGGLVALLLDYYLSPLLFDFGADGRPLPWILPAAEAFIFLIAAIALYGPVRRALRVDPVEALREG